MANYASSSRHTNYPRSPEPGCVREVYADIDTGFGEPRRTLIARATGAVCSEALIREHPGRSDFGVASQPGEHAYSNFASFLVGHAAHGEVTLVVASEAATHGPEFAGMTLGSVLEAAAQVEAANEHVAVAGLQIRGDVALPDAVRPAPAGPATPLL